MSVGIPSAIEPVLQSRYPHRPRVLIALRRRADVSSEKLERALGDWRRRWDTGVEFGTLVARAGVAIAEEQDALVERFRAAGTSVEALDGYVSLDLECYAPSQTDFDLLFSAAERCLDTLADVVDPAESVAFAGVANLVIPGFAPLSMILVLDRHPGLSLEEYNHWWVHHGDDHRRVNPGQVGYHQLHIAPEFNALVAASVGAAVTRECIIDIMYLGHVRDAFPEHGGRLPGEEERALAADIGAHVSFSTVKGSIMREL